jgi:hypothetical protein
MKNRNDITGDLLKSKPNSSEYEVGYDRIFNKEPVQLDLFDSIVGEPARQSKSQLKRESVQRGGSIQDALDLFDSIVEFPCKISRRDGECVTALNTGIAPTYLKPQKKRMAEQTKEGDCV